MDTPTTSEAALKLEIARLSGAINQYKSTSFGYRPPRGNTYVNPNYKPSNKYIRPGLTAPTPTPAAPKPSTSTNRPISTPSATPQPREVVLGGVAFHSSARSLVRKDLPKPATTTVKPPVARPIPTDFSRTKTGHLVPNGRVYKPKSSSRGRRGLPGPKNMTLNNRRRPYQSQRSSRKFTDKPCPRFTTTGACSRGLTCTYQHDPSKIAICWPFLQGNCPNNADNCNLSHDPTPERTPLCMHFANNGRCTRENCPFPHVRVGSRHGVCRDFAVLGYCAKGLDCENQHVRECPDFAEKGACSTKGCKLPHVIRANRNRKPAADTTAATSAVAATTGSSSATDVLAGTDDNVSSTQHASAEDAQLGDEFISLTFNESESSEEESDDDGGDDDDEDEEGADPTDTPTDPV